MIATILILLLTPPVIGRVVDAVGAGVEGIKIGDKVSTIPSPFAKMSEYGVYGESAIVPAQIVAPF